MKFRIADFELRIYFSISDLSNAGSRREISNFGLRIADLFSDFGFEQRKITKG